MATIRTDLSNAEYRKVCAYSKSDLDLLHKSPALIEWSRNAPRQPNTTAEIGTATHAALLEPEEFAKNYCSMPNTDRRTKAGKQEAEAFELSAAASGFTAMASADYDMVIAMRDSVKCHPVADELLSRPGQSEASIFWDSDGLKLKCRPDRICSPEHFGRHILVDVKTTDDVEKFAFSVRDYRYHVQAAFYSDGYEALTGHAPEFWFVVVGKRLNFGAHPVRVFKLDHDSVCAGRDEYMADLEIARELDAFGTFLEPEIISLPKSWR